MSVEKQLDRLLAKTDVIFKKLENVGQDVARLEAERQADVQRIDNLEGTVRWGVRGVLVIVVELAVLLVQGYVG